MSFLGNLSAGFVNALEGPGILIMIAGVAWGIIGGAIPGISGAVAMALALPFTFTLDAATALVMLAGVWAGANYGGSIPAILMRIPGTPGSAAALLDGYELTRQGHAAKALGVSLVCGTIGGVVSILVLIVLVLPLGELVLYFGSPEVFALALFGLTLIAGLSGPSFLKGLASGFFGLLLTTVGLDTLTGSLRFTFGRAELLSGIDMISAMIGLFAVSEMFHQIAARRHRVSWLEFSCQNPVNFPQTFDRARVRRVRRLVERSGIRCGVHSASFVNTAEIMPTVRKATDEHLKEYVDLTAALGCEYLVIHCGFHFSVYLDRVRAAMRETVTRCVEYAERRRVPLVIENMNPLPSDSEFQYLGVTAEEFTDLFRRIRSPYLGLALDVAHCHLLPGGTARFVRAFPDRIRAVQLSDNRGRVDEHLTIGEGTVDFAGVLNLLRGIEFSGPLIIELFDVRKKLRSRTRLLRLLGARRDVPASRRPAPRAKPAESVTAAANRRIAARRGNTGRT